MAPNLPQLRPFEPPPDLPRCPRVSPFCMCSTTQTWLRTRSTSSCLLEARIHTCRSWRAVDRPCGRSCRRTCGKNCEARHPRTWQLRPQRQGKDVPWIPVSIGDLGLTPMKDSWMRQFATRMSAHLRAKYSRLVGRHPPRLYDTRISLESSFVH